MTSPASMGPFQKDPPESDIDGTLPEGTPMELSQDAQAAEEGSQVEGKSTKEEVVCTECKERVDIKKAQKVGGPRAKTRVFKCNRCNSTQKRINDFLKKAGNEKLKAEWSTLSAEEHKDANNCRPLLFPYHFELLRGWSGK